MRRTATARSLALALAAAAGSTATAGDNSPIRWAAPVSGDFSNPDNWTGGMLPSPSAPAIIDAAGSPYEVLLAQFSDIPITVDSDDATLRYAVDIVGFINATPPNSRLDVRRGALVMSSGSETVDLAPIHIAAGANIRFEGTLTESISRRIIRLGRDLDLGGTATFEGRATVSMLADSFFGGFPTPLASLAQSAIADFAGGNLLVGGITTNNGTMRFLNNPEFDYQESSFDLTGSRIGFVQDNTFPQFTTTFLNHGVVLVEQSDLTLGSIGLHSGEFRLNAGSRLVLEESQHFTSESRITGDGIIVAAADHISGTFSSQSDLRLTRGGQLNASLNIEGDLVIQDNPYTRDVEFLGPVTIGGELTANGGALTFRSGFEGSIFSPLSGGVGAAARSIEIFGPAQVYGNLRPREGTIFHDAAIVHGDVYGALFESTGIIYGNTFGAAFQQAATITGDAAGVILSQGGSIGGNASGDIFIRRSTSIAGDFTQSTLDRSEFTRASGNAGQVFIGGDADILSLFFSSTMPIHVQGDFRTIAGRLTDITADTVTFGGTTALGTGTVSLSRGSEISSDSRPARIQRASVALYRDVDGATGFVSFMDGFEIIYIPITQFTRSGFYVAINADEDRNDVFYFFADSSLAGTLDVGIFGDSGSLAIGDSFTILEARRPLNSDAPLATITGEFDRLFLPTLPGDLFFDVVYEPHAVRLVVVPAPTPAAAFSLFGVAAARRRRRAKALAGSAHPV